MHLATYVAAQVTKLAYTGTSTITGSKQADIDLLKLFRMWLIEFL